MLQSSNKFSASASVLAQFLPCLDELWGLKVKYEEDPFGKQYGAMAGAMRSAFLELGVEEYTAEAGEAVDLGRMTVTEWEKSEEIPKDTVIRPLSIGLELKGNVIRPANCVASLGSETAVEEEAEVAENEDAAVETDEPTAEASDEEPEVSSE